MTYLNRMINSKKVFTILMCALVFGCKSTKRISSSGELDASLTAKQIIKAHNKQKASFKTMQGRIKVEYTQGEYSQTHTITIRMQRDKTIWLNSSFSIVRAMITPDKVGYYNKLDNTYFDGDFSLISEFLGTELTFNNLQSLLLGESLFELNDKTYEADVFDISYVLSPKDQNALFEVFLLLNPTHFKMDSQQIAQPVERRMLQIDYKDYQVVEKQIFPQNIEIFAVEADVETVIKMDFKSISLNEELRFPFRIPSGFDPIEIK